MSNRTATLQDFIANATSVLHQVEMSLTDLAQTALLEHGSSLSDQENGNFGNRPNADPRLQHVSQQLLKLSEHSRLLKNYLQNSLDSLPAIGDHWPQIRVLQSQEEERAQLARELEDGVGQLLANAIFELASCRHLLDGEREAVADGLNALQAELEHGLTDIRHFITNLEPATILSNFGLAGGIRRYLEQYEVKTGLKTQLLMKTNMGRLPSIVETAIFRIIQEALSNVFQHAGATQVDVVVEEIEGALQFSVIDNGDGLISEKISTDKRNLGLARMVDYAELLNGTLRILSEPGQGTQVIFVVPYPTL